MWRERHTRCDSIPRILSGECLIFAFMRIVNIRTIDIYRDGGTIGIRCFGYPTDELKSQEFEICFDDRLSSTPDGVFWLGYPNYPDSKEITDEQTIKHIVDCLIDFRDIQQSRINRVISNYKWKKGEQI